MAGCSVNRAGAKYQIVHYVLLSQCSFEKPAYVRIVNVIFSTKM